MKIVATIIFVSMVSAFQALASETGFNSISFGTDNAVAGAYVGTAWQIDDNYKLPVRLGYTGDDQKNSAYSLGVGIAKAFKKTEHVVFSVGSTVHTVHSETAFASADQLVAKGYLEIEVQFSEFPGLGFNMQGGVYYQGTAHTKFALYNESPISSGFTYHF
ncbi:MAG: hypothetical protein ACXVCY_12350 [Pseudobdellovibrionaceae bacterium]